MNSEDKCIFTGTKLLIMTTIDRSIPPITQRFQDVIFNKPTEYRLQNGISVSMLPQLDTQIISLSFDIKAGEFYQPQPFVVSATQQLLTKGSLHFSSKLIAEKIASKGADIRVNFGTDFASINLICLKSKLKSLLPYLNEIIFHPRFDEAEIEQLKEKELQILHLKEQKVDFLSNRQFFLSTFGNDHPLGKILEEKHILQISTSELKDFHSKYYTPSRTSIFCAGAVDETTFELLNKTFGQDLNSISQRSKKDTSYKRSETKEKFQFIEKLNAVQSSIKEIGRAHV